jgi:hypothetical protein
LALRSPHSCLVVRRPQPGLPGVFPLRTCSTRPMSRHFGPCRRPS